MYHISHLSKDDITCHVLLKNSVVYLRENESEKNQIIYLNVCRKIIVTAQTP